VKKHLTLEHVPPLKMPMVTKQTPSRPLRSGELAGLAGVSRDTLRYYERNRLLPAVQRSQNGYRRYPPQAIDRVRLIRAALGIGFTVQELGEVFAARDKGEAPCRRVHVLAVEKADDLALRIAELKRVHKALQSAIRSWSRKLQSTAPGKRAGLLEMFVANHPESTRAISPLVPPGLKRRPQRKEDKSR
jgi:DNA-binding transcriptional MerR regulator